MSNEVNTRFMESIAENIGGMNVVDFVYSIEGEDHIDAYGIVKMAETFSMSVNDFLDYLQEHYQFDDHNVYEEFMHIITREVDRQFEERGR